MPSTSLSAFKTSLEEKFIDSLTVRADVLIDQNSNSISATEFTTSQARPTVTLSTTDTIAVNDIVLFNSNAEVKKVESTTTTQTFSIGTANQFAQNTQKTDIEFDPNTDQFILMYRDRTVDGLRSHLVSVASDGTLTVSADFEVYDSNILFPAGFYHKNAQRMVIFFQLDGVSANNYSIGTIAGTAISWSTPASQPRSGGGDEYGLHNRAVEITGTNFLVHAMNSQPDGRACYATLFEIDNDVLVQHDRQRINSTASNQGRHYDVDLSYMVYGGNHFIITSGKENGDANQGTSYVFRIDLATNTLIPDTTQHYYTSTHTVNHQTAIVDPNENVFVIVYRDESNSNQGHYIVGELTGDTTTPTINFGTVNTFQTGINRPRLVYNHQTNQVACTYIDTSDGNSTKMVTGTVSQATLDVTWGTVNVISTSSCSFPVMAFNSNNNTFVSAYEDITANESYVQSTVVPGSYTTTNALQWVGIAKTTNPTIELYKQGDTVSGLSLTAGQPIYVNYDGTLTQTPNEGEYLGTYGKIGIALTSNQMLITEGSRNG